MHTEEIADFRRPYILRLEDMGADDYQVHYRTAMRTFDSWTQQDWAALEPILAGIDSLYYEWSQDEPLKQNSTFGRIARAEFFWVMRSEQKACQGVVLFDNYRRAILHATNALLGYGGSGPDLSRQILMAIGVSEDMFDEVNASVEPREYDNVVFSRESTGVMIGNSMLVGGEPCSDLHRTGDIITNPGDPVSNTWTWWRG